ncbi:MAG: hypothetical protein ACRDOP_01600, partial [Gaiellaceae bacterium]
RAAFLVVASTLFVSGCSLGGGDGEAQEAGDVAGAPVTVAPEPQPDAEALRAAWAAEVGAACAERNEQIEALARALPGVVEEKGLAGAAARFEPIDRALLERLNEAEPAPGDDVRAQEMAALYRQAAQAEARALGTSYVKRDRRFYALMRRSEAAHERADAIATELGAQQCAVASPGMYATVAGLAAVRWGDRASKLCRARDRTFSRLRSTDTARFEAATRLWLRQMRALRAPKRYARRIDRFLDQQAASEQALDAADVAFARNRRAAGEALVDTSNRLTSRSSEVMYRVAFEIGFVNFCS